MRSAEQEDMRPKGRNGNVSERDPVGRRRKELARALKRGDETRAAVLRGELVKLHRRALQRALALDDAEAAADINAEMTADLGPLLPCNSQCAHAVILDKRRETARQLIASIGPFELERVSVRPECFLAITESADGSVQVNALLRDEAAVESFYRQLVSTTWPLDVRHDLDTALVARLEALSDNAPVFGAEGTA